MKEDGEKDTCLLNETKESSTEQPFDVLNLVDEPKFSSSILPKTLCVITQQETFEPDADNIMRLMNVPPHKRARFKFACYVESI